MTDDHRVNKADQRKPQNRIKSDDRGVHHEVVDHGEQLRRCPQTDCHIVAEGFDLLVNDHQQDAITHMPETKK